MKNILLSLITSLPLISFAQFVTGAAPVQDGTITAAEYYNSTGGNWYMCWDNTYLYIAKTGGANGEPDILYFDTNPTASSAGGVATGANGQTTGKNDFNVTPNLPFVGKARVYWTENYAEVTNNSGSGWGAAIPITTRTGAGNNREIKIPWTSLGALASRPAAFNWLGTASSTSNPGFIYDPYPAVNYSGNSSNTPTYYYYQSIESTANGTATNPFTASRTSFSNYNINYAYTNVLPATLYDFTIGKSGGASFTTALKTNISIGRDLVVENGIFINNSTGFTQTVQMNGSNGNLYVFTAAGGHIYGTDAGLGNNMGLIVNTGASITVNGDASVANTDDHKFYNITVQSGATLALGRGILCRYGVFTVNGTLQINANGYVEGVAASAIPVSYGSGTTLVYNNGGPYTTTNFEWPTTNAPANVTVQNTGTNILLNSTKTINQILTLGAGILSTGANKVIMTSSGVVSQVSGWVNGNLQKNIATGPTFQTFEIGDATNYTPVAITFGNVITSGDLTAKTTPGDHPQIAGSGLNPLRDANRYWTLTNSGIVFTNYSATLNFVPADLDPTANPASFKVAKYDLGTWTLPSTTANTATSTQASGMTSFSDFAVGNLSVLPITIQYIRGYKQSNGNLIEWKVGCASSPYANLSLERSSDGINFSIVYDIRATSVRCQQQFDHVDLPMPGINYYRLKMVDEYGEVLYSSILNLVNKGVDFSFYSLIPSLVNSAAILNVNSSKASSMQLSVMDMQGRSVQSLSVSLVAGNNQVNLNLGKLSAGVYVIKGVTSENQVATTRFVKD